MAESQCESPAEAGGTTAAIDRAPAASRTSTTQTQVQVEFVAGILWHKYETYM